MKSKLRAVCTVLVTAMSAVGCSVSTSTDAPAEHVKQTSDDLSVYQWSADYQAYNSHSYDGASIATFTRSGHDYTFMVHTGNDLGDHTMYWAYSYDGINWTQDSQIDAMYTSTQAQLGAFNGYLYMVHSGDHDNSVWMSRFNTASWSWDHDFLLPYQSAYSPSLVSFNGALYIIGTTPGSGQVWQATMDTSEAFSAPSNLPGLTAFSGAPSLAVHCPGSFCFQPTLYMAYKSGMGEVTMSGLQVSIGRRGGTPTWWTPWVVTNTDGSHKKTSVTPALASYGGDLHLVYATPATSDRIMWTYYDGSNWSTDVSIAGQLMSTRASLAARSERLVMVHTSSAADHTNGDVPVYSEYFQ